jgi:predicted RNase H-like HicB family nuclease
MQAIALIHEENGTYTASFPDFPGCSAIAGDPDAVIVRATEALALHIERTIENGRELPRVRSLALLAADPIFAASSASQMIALVPYGSTRPVRLTIAVEEGLLARVDRAAEAVGETRSGYLSRAARQRLIREASVEVPRTPEMLTEAPFDGRTASHGRLEKPPFPNDAPTDAAASLASIREMLERLDTSATEDPRQPLLRPARRGVL